MNRFKMAIEGRGKEILDAGKKEGDGDLNIKNKPIEFDEKDIDDIKIDVISSFLCGRINSNSEELRLNSIKDIFNSIVEAFDSGKSVVIKDFKNYINYWLSALKNILSLKMYDSIEKVEEYEGDIETCTLYNKGLDAQKIEESFIYDFTNKNDNIPKYNLEFSKFVQTAYFIDKKEIARFKEMLDEIDYEKFDSSIEVCFKLYKFIYKKSIDYENDFIDIMNFEYQHGSLEAKRKLFEALDGNAEVIRNTADNEKSECVIKFMYDFAQKSIDKIWYNKTFKFIFNSINYIIRNKSVMDADKFFLKVKLIINDDHEFADYTLGDDSLRSIEKCIDIDNQYVDFYFNNIVRILVEKKIDWNYSSEFSNFAKICISKISGDKDKVKSAVHNFNNDPEYIGHFLTLYYNENKEDCFNLYLEQVNDLAPEQANIVRKILFRDDNCKNMLFQEFTADLENAEDKSGYFWNYVSSVLDDIEDYKNERALDIAKYYIDNIFYDEKSSIEYMKFLKLIYEEKIELDSDTIKKLIGNVENSIDVNIIDDQIEDNIKMIKDIKERNNINTNDDTEKLFDYTLKIKNIKSSDEMYGLIKENYFDVQNMDAQIYKKFLCLNIRILLSKEFIDANNVFDFYKSIRNSSGIQDDGMLEAVSEISGGVSLSINKIRFRMSAILLILNEQGVSQDKSIAYFANIILKYYLSSDSKNVRQNILDYIFEKEDENGEEWTKDLRDILLKVDNSGELLIHEYEKVMDRVTDKKAAFHAYAGEMFKNTSEYKKMYYSKAVSYYLSIISKKAIYHDECISILKNVLNDSSLFIDKNVLNKLICEFENEIQFSDFNKQESEYILKIAKLKDTLNIKTDPDITLMIEAGLNIKNAEVPSSVLDVLVNTKINYDKMSKKRYSAFAKWFMRIVCSKVDFLEFNDKIKDFLFIDKYSDEYLNEYVEEVVNRLDSVPVGNLSDKLKDLFKSLVKSAKIFSTVMLKYFKSAVSQNYTDYAVNLFIESLNRCSENEKLNIRKEVAGLKGGGDLLYEEFKTGIQNSLNKQDFFEKYNKSVLNNIKEYKKLYLNDILSFYIDELKGSSGYEDECLFMIKNIIKKGINVNENVMKKLIEVYESTLQMSMPDESENKSIEDILKIKQKYSIKTSPDIIKLIGFGMKLSKIKGENEVRNFIKKANVDLKGITMKKYGEFLTWCLPKVLSCANTWQMHAEIKRVFYYEKYKIIYYTKYLSILSECMDSKKFEVNRIAYDYILYFFNNIAQFDEEIMDLVKTNFMLILSKQPDGKIKEFENTIKSEATGMRNREIILRELNELINKIERKAKNKKDFMSFFRM